MGAMKNTIRGCISCILPCGALDVIRIVHCNGRVEEFSWTILAGEVMKAHPKHVLKRSSLSATEDGVVPRIIILPPDAELGKIYFLMPVVPPSLQSDKARAVTVRRKNKMGLERKKESPIGQETKFLDSDQYLSEILSEKMSPYRDQKRGRVGVWRPHLESISEASSES